MLNRYKVTTRLIALCVFPIVVLIFSYIIAIKDMQSLNENMTSMYNESIVPLRELKRLADSYAVTTVDAFQKYRADLITLQELKTTLSEAAAVGERSWTRLSSGIMDTEERRLIDDIEHHLTSALRLKEEFIQSADQGRLKSIQATEFNSRLFGTFDPLSAAIDEATNYQLVEASALRDKSEQQYVRDRNLFTIVGTLAVLLTALIAWLISRSIQRPISSLVKAMSDISTHSDLTIRTEVEGKDELAQVGESFNQLISHFQKLIHNLAGASQTLAASAEEMSAISTQVSGSARNQEDQTTMIATAINEMTAAISEVATNAQNASSSADHANDQARQGLSRTRETIKMIESLASNISKSASQISELDAQAEQISEVLDMIESIAEQTNLLALNAAIEAARAGDAGRGFAVVADEVRNLAASTRQSTERIQSSISKLQTVAKQAVQQMQLSNEAAQQGVENAKINGETFEAVSGAVGTIVDMNVHISSATEEQTAVANDINQNIHTVVSTVSEVVEGAEQTSIASQQLSELAQQLKYQVEQFKV